MRPRWCRAHAPRSGIGHIFLKPKVTRTAALAYGFTFDYEPRPRWQTYARLIAFASRIRHDLALVAPDDKPRDMIDLQSFIWVLGSDEYA
jgi:hypothetical protein